VILSSNGTELFIDCRNLSSKESISLAIGAFMLSNDITTLLGN
jgi:hypothetical protein